MLISGANSLFPIDLVRVVFLMNATPVLTNPLLSWFVLLSSYTVLFISFYIGLPRRPMPKPIRRRRRGTSTNHIQTPNFFGLDYETVLQLIAKTDTNLCFARYLCHVGSQKYQEMTSTQKMMINFIMATANGTSEFERLVPGSRNGLLEAIQFGQTTQCWNCCQTQYPMRVAILMPATPVLKTPSYSWAVFLLSVGTLVLSAYIGYPRVPTLKPLIRRKLKQKPFRRGRSADYSYNTIFEMIAEMEPKKCFSRYLCHIATMDSTEITIFQRLMMNYISFVQGVAQALHVANMWARVKEEPALSGLRCQSEVTAETGNIY
ncbi:hypothetical protein CHUAL_010622 [Chamberlinius hualienensis]